MTNFMDAAKEHLLKNTFSLTENGAVGYANTLTALTDLNFRIASYRGATAGEIESDFVKAFYECPLLAVQYLFYASDVRGGLGERRFFRLCFKWLADTKPHYVRVLLDLVPEYSRWDNLFCLIGTDVEPEVIELLRKQLLQDIANLKTGKPISLLAKWLPSINTSSEETRALARKLCSAFKMPAKVYRKTLSALRKKIGIVESQMSANKWKDINYEHVPSRANLKYNKAFLRQDEERRRQFLMAVESGEKKIHGAVNFPHDIVHSMCNTNNSQERRTLEELWKALPDYLAGSDDRIMTVVDGSGSMTYGGIGNTNIQPIEVAWALGIYFAERLKGEFHDQYITFSANPQYVDMRWCTTLWDKIQLSREYDDCSNTDIYKVFKMVLNTARTNGMSQELMPTKILIISDMEFDHCAEFDLGMPLFKGIEEEYKRYGYELPGIVFWNVSSRTKTVPMQQNKRGLALVSGFSPSITKMVLSGKLDPFAVLLEQLQTERYAVIAERLNSI
jgi:hypothetical protein